MAQADEARFARNLAAAFLVLSIGKALVHEPWRDEWSPWGTALDCGSAAEVWEAVKYGGHPRIWPLVVFAIQRTIGGFLAVQMLIAVAATAGAWIFARFAPFPRPARVVFAFGYFPFFEYGSLARPYAFALVAVCAAAATFSAARRRPFPFAVALVALEQTSVFGVILAAAFGAAWIADRLRAPRDERALPARAAIAALLVVAGAAFSVFQMAPPVGEGYSPEWHTAWERARFLRVLATVPRALLPLPKPQLHFWNTHVLDGHDVAGAATGGVLVAVVAALLVRRPPALLFWLVAVAGQLAFECLKYEGFARHHGHLFLAFVAAWWMSTDGESVGDRLRRALLGLVLVSQFAAALFAVAMDAVLPFSTARAAARELTARGLDGLPLVGHRAATASAVAAALGRPMVLVGTGRTAAAMTWDPKTREASTAEAVAAARDIAASRRTPVVLVLDAAFVGASPPQVEFVVAMKPAIVRDESFVIYVLRP